MTFVDLLRACLASSALALVAVPASSWAQTAAETMQQVRDSAHKDKRALVEQQLKLDPAQAKDFWPLYERYQQDLLAINRRSTVAVVDYVNVQDRLTDGAAQQLLREITAVETDRAKLNEAYLKRFLKVLPGKQVARYYQLESKIHAVQAYDSASQIPLVK
jgi:hypothetical protein